MLSNSYYEVLRYFVMTKLYKKIILISMRNFLNNVQISMQQKRALLIFLILLTVVLIVLGVVASINFSGGVLVVDLSNIAYIQFLKDECSFGSLMFKLLLSLFLVSV